MKIKTNILQEMVAKAIKGAGNNKMIPITSLIGIRFKDNKLTLMTTDGNNQLKVTNELEYNNSLEFYSIVNADTFSKLVAKTTREYIELENNDNFLEIKGNGTYKLDIPINEDGEIIKFPEHSIDSDDIMVIDSSILKQTLDTAKAALAKTMEVPVLTGYYLSDKIITTDRQMICYIDSKLLEKPILISSETADLLLLLEGKISIVTKDNKLLFKSNSISIYANQLDGIDNYPVEPILNLIQQNYNNNITVDKQELLNIIDRMSLFVSDYDKNGVYLDFTTEGLVITSQKSNASETLNYNDTKEITSFNCLIDIEMFKAQLESLTENIVTIYYGQETSIQLKENDTILIISLLDKNN